MEFTLKIDADNAAFDGDDLPMELARILRKLASKVERELTRDESDGFSVSLYDVNGNKVGSAQVRLMAPADQLMQRCPTCLGMGYKGRYRRRITGKTWKIESCQRCGGRGECTAKVARRAAKGGQ